MAARNGKLPLGTFEQIAEAGLGEGELVPVPKWGISVRVRGLTRGEARETWKLDDAGDREASIFACAFLEPKLTPEQARQIANDKGFQETEAVLEKIMQLSGLTHPDIRPAAEMLVAAVTRNEDGTVTIPAPVLGQLEAALSDTFRSE